MMRTLSRNVSTAFPSTPEPTFLPVQSCHKRVEERPQVNTFTDVADSAYYADAVKWATEQGITKGISSTLFGPDETCTRAQIVTFLYRMYGSK